MKAALNFAQCQNEAIIYHPSSFSIFDPSFQQWSEFYANKIGPTRLNFTFNMIVCRLQILNKLSIFQIQSNLIGRLFQIGADFLFIPNRIWWLIHFKLDLMVCTIPIGSDTVCLNRIQWFVTVRAVLDDVFIREWIQLDLTYL